MTGVRDGAGGEPRPLQPAAPGWYPVGAGHTRYWDGRAWTAHVAPAPVPQPPLQVAPKSPGLALLASFFLPGLGQLVNGQAAKGILVFVMWVLSLASILVLVGFLLAPVVWVWSMVDAYSDARRWNARHGVVS